MVGVNGPLEYVFFDFVVLALFQHRLKSSQRERAREFAALTQTGEKTALFCLAQHEWKLDLALDNYFANPELYYREPKTMTDKKKLDLLYSKYRGKNGNALGRTSLLNMRFPLQILQSRKK